MSMELLQFEQRLGGTRFAGRVTLVDAVDSTIDEARAACNLGAPEGTTVIALAQRKGRGQHGRTWHSPHDSSLFISTLLRPRLMPEQCPILGALAGLAARDTVADMLGLESVVLKRPNDLIVAHGKGWRKLAGVLVDTAVQGPELKHAIVSMGLNLAQREEDFPEPLRGLATSLLIETGHAPSVLEAAAAFLSRLEVSFRDLERLGAPEWIASTEARYHELSRATPEFTLPVLA